MPCSGGICSLWRLSLPRLKVAAVPSLCRLVPCYDMRPFFHIFQYSNEVRKAVFYRKFSGFQMLVTNISKFLILQTEHMCGPEPTLGPSSWLLQIALTASIPMYMSTFRYHERHTDLGEALLTQHCRTSVKEFNFNGNLRQETVSKAYKGTDI